VEQRPLTYFVSDIHLGLQQADPAGREARFVAFLRGIDPARTESLYLLGDIWDFWHEYRDVVPRGYIRVFAALVELMDAGVKIYFFPGNHDYWSYQYFEDLGITRLKQPKVVEIGPKRFCLGHGDGLGPVSWKYRVVQAVFHNRTCQRLFATLHPWIAYRWGTGWSASSRKSQRYVYVFKGEAEPLYKYCTAFPEPVDYFIFGHYHCRVDMPIGNARLLLLSDWLDASNWMVYDQEADILSVIYK